MNKWQDMFVIEEVHFQLDWGDHPMTGDWSSGWIVKNIATGKQASDRRYSRKVDAKVGAAMMFRSIQKSIEKTLLG
jgi:hypothetical protein